MIIGLQSEMVLIEAFLKTKKNLILSLIYKLLGNKYIRVARATN